MSKERFQTVFIILQAATACVFAGRAWQHLFWDAPYRELFWDASIMQFFVEQWTSWTWHEYVTDPAVDEGIRNLIVATGLLYAFCTIVAVLIRKLPGFFRFFLWMGAASLVFLAFLYMKDHFYHFGQFLEYSLQFGSPLFLLIALRTGRIDTPLAFWMKMATGLTFACHGLYAIGFYPVPGSYLEMTIRILGISQDAAVSFLKIMSILDFVVLVGVFLPLRWAKWVFLYAAAWGLATSLARIFGNFYWDFAWNSLHQWAFETVYRLPHFLIPFALWTYAQGNAGAPDSGKV